MVKKLSLLVLALLLWGTPQAISAQTEKDGIEAEATGTTLLVSGTMVHICNGAGSVLEIYNLTGIKIASYRIDSADKKINLSLQKGCYILKINKVVRKVSIR